MGLLTTFDNTLNKETQQALMVTYTVSQSEQFGGYWIVTRMATKYYRYVGMTYAAAKFCADEKVRQYTRDYARVIAHTDETTGEITPTVVYTKECKSSIAAQKTTGSMWETVVQVNEYDEKIAETLVTDPSTYFQAENQRDYDEEAKSSLQITDVTIMGSEIIQILVSGTNIPDFPLPQYAAKFCTVYVSFNYGTQNEEWQIVPCVNEQWHLDIISTSVAVKCQYGPYMSNVFIAPR